VYRDTVGHFDTKERLGNVFVLRHWVRRLQSLILFTVMPGGHVLGTVEGLPTSILEEYGGSFVSRIMTYI
jgi:hypothetical protein